MINDIWFWRPFRRVMLKVQKYAPERIQDWILDRLYPDNCIVTFGNGEEAL